jgi:hypothetical protein
MACGLQLQLNPFIVDAPEFSPPRWRRDPQLAARFNGTERDDLQVVFYDGVPGHTGRSPEKMWVRTFGNSGDLYRGILLNRPHALTNVQEGDVVLFRAVNGAQDLFHFSTKYLQEREDWEIVPCSVCGLDEARFSPSELLEATIDDPERHPQINEILLPCTECKTGNQRIRRRTSGVGSGIVPNEGQAAPAHAAAMSHTAGVATPSASPNSDAQLATRRNIEYQQALDHWQALPWWRRLRTKQPKPPQGI